MDNTKYNQTARVFVNRSEPFDPDKFAEVVSKGVVVGETTTHWRIWVTDDKELNTTQLEAEWFPKNSKRVKVIVSEVKESDGLQ